MPSYVSRILLVLTLLTLATVNAQAQTTCTNVDASTGSVTGSVSCTGTGAAYSGRIGAAASVATGAATQDNITVNTANNTSIGLNSTNFGPNTATIILRDVANITIGDNATVSAPNSGAAVNNQAIYFRNNGTLNIGSGATVINYATGGNGIGNTGNNTIEFNSNNTVNIGSGATIYAAGSSGSSEAINPTGSGNTIDNSGTIKSATGAAIWFQNTTTGTANTVINRASGLIQAGTGNQAFGASARGDINFTNYGQVVGNVTLSESSTNNVSLYTGSSISGSLNGGGKATGSSPNPNNTLTLAGAGTQNLTSAVTGSVTNFQTLAKIDSGTWTLGNKLSTITGLSTVNVNAGTLVLQSDNSGFTGATTVSSGATLQGDALAIQGSQASGATNLTNNGTIAFTDSGSGTYSGKLAGTGGITMAGTGTLTLSGSSTFTGNTAINSGGTLALADSGSIANSAAVNNNGTFDITQKTSNTSLGGTYTQASTGTLKMGLTPNSNPQLVVSGAATIAGTLSVTAAPGHYSAGRYTLVNAGSLTGTFSRFTNNFDEALSKYSLSYDAHDVFLNLNSDFTEVDNANTVHSVQINAAGLATMYNQQAAAYQAALTYDCRVYDEHNLCVSVGGRYTYAGPSPSANQQAGLVVLGYKPAQTVRMGAFADQSINISTPSGFSQSKTSPMWGLFAKWHMNPDETGLGVQASGVTSASSLNITRPQLLNTEAGSGTTQFNGQGYQLTTNYHQPVSDAASVVPYIGLRYTRVSTGAYTENNNANVTLPLAYNAMAQNTFSAIGGLGVRSLLAEKLTGTASVGIQQNLKYSMSNYQVSSAIVGLENFSVAMPGNVNSMATATAGLTYDINKRERLGLNILWQQQPFIATNTTTAIATYTIGF